MILGRFCRAIIACAVTIICAMCLFIVSIIKGIVDTVIHRDIVFLTDALVIAPLIIIALFKTLLIGIKTRDPRLMKEVYYKETKGL